MISKLLKLDCCCTVNALLQLILYATPELPFCWLPNCVKLLINMSNCPSGWHTHFTNLCAWLAQNILRLVNVVRSAQGAFGVKAQDKKYERSKYLSAGSFLLPIWWSSFLFVENSKPNKNVLSEREKNLLIWPHWDKVDQIAKFVNKIRTKMQSSTFDVINYGNSESKSTKSTVRYRIFKSMSKSNEILP